MYLVFLYGLVIVFRVLQPLCLLMEKHTLTVSVSQCAGGLVVFTASVSSQDPTSLFLAMKVILTFYPAAAAALKTTNVFVCVCVWQLVRVLGQIG